MLSKTKVIITLVVFISSILVYFIGTNYNDNAFVFEEKVEVKTESLNELGNLDLYDYYNTLVRPHTDDYSLYVLNPYDDVYLLERYNNLSMDEIISSCRRIPYEAEVDGVEYPKYPVETIVENCGDCEDKAILCASILSLKGFNVSLIRFDTHMTVLFNNTLIETTGTTNRYLLGDAVCVYPVISHSVFVLDWNATIYSHDSRYFVSFNVSISNYGDTNDEAVLYISDNISCYNFSFWVDTLTVKNIELNVEVLSKDIDLKLLGGIL